MSTVMDLPWFYFEFPKVSPDGLSRSDANPPSILVQRELQKHMRARRLSTDQEFVLTNGRNRLYRCRLSDDEVHIIFLSPIPLTKPKGKIRLLLPALEKSRLNPLIAQLTSLGVLAVFFYESSYSQRRRIDRPRLQAISRAALTQCKRPQAIRFGPPHELSLFRWLDILEKAVARDRIYFLPALPKESPLEYLSLDERPVYLLIGPEGGFDESEGSRLRELAQTHAKSVRPVGLGPYILRTETAALALTAIAQGQFH